MGCVQTKASSNTLNEKDQTNIRGVLNDSSFTVFRIPTLYYEKEWESIMSSRVPADLLHGRITDFLIYRKNGTIFKANQIRSFLHYGLFVSGIYLRKLELSPILILDLYPGGTLDDKLVFTWGGTTYTLTCAGKFSELVNILMQIATIPSHMEISD